MPKLDPCEDGSYIFWCPGCEQYHRFGPEWTYNGNPAAPTFRPSLVTRIAPGRSCHLFLTAGKLEYLSDSWHHLKARVVDLPDVG